MSEGYKKNLWAYFYFVSFSIHYPSSDPIMVCFTFPVPHHDCSAFYNSISVDSIMMNSIIAPVLVNLEKHWFVRLKNVLFPSHVSIFGSSSRDVVGRDGIPPPRATHPAAAPTLRSGFRASMPIWFAGV